MTSNLCVTIPMLGASFVDKHTHRLRPGLTVAASLRCGHPHENLFPAQCPGMVDAFLQAVERFQAFGQAGYRRAAADYGWEQEKSPLNNWLAASEGAKPAA